MTFPVSIQFRKHWWGSHCDRTGRHYIPKRKIGVFLVVAVHNTARSRGYVWDGLTWGKRRWPKRGTATLQGNHRYQGLLGCWRGCLCYWEITDIPDQSEYEDRTVGKLPKRCSRALILSGAIKGQESTMERRVLGERASSVASRLLSPIQVTKSSTLVKPGERDKEHVWLSLGPDSPLRLWVASCKAGEEL